MRTVPSDSDINGFSHCPNELSEELVRTVASLHQRAAEPQSLGAPLARTSSQGFGSSKRKFGRRSSQVSSTNKPLALTLLNACLKRAKESSIA